MQLVLNHMDAQKLHIRHCMLYAFNRGLSGAAAAEEICGVYGDGSTTKSTCDRWFARFRSGDTTLTDQPREGRPSTFDDDALQCLLQMNPRQTTRELAEQLDCAHTTVEDHLHTLGKIQKYGSWVPHELSADNKIQRVSVCASLLSHHHSYRFLDRIVTGDEKWVLYVNIRRKRQWLASDEKPLPDAKTDLHPKKVLLCIWWDAKGVLYWELLDNNQTITAEVYAQQLQRLQEALLQKRPALVNRKGVILLHDNARPHVAKLTREKIQELGWEVLPHPPYSPDIAPSDYHLFRSLQNHLAEKRFEDDDTVNSDLAAFFASKPPDFYKSGIDQLPIRWTTVVDNNGDYIID